jgi:hypothetical protein
VNRARTFLHGLQRADGLVVEPGMPTPNHAWCGLALLADTSVDEASNGGFRQALVDGLLAVKGIALDEDDTPVRQNNRLQAWAWIDGTFSWIEPTAMCVLALKKSRASGAAVRTRLTEAEAMMLDRVCQNGGWNYGNANVLGQDLRPYVPTTAAALLAMQDHRDHASIDASLGWLRTHATSEPATMALAWSALALRTFGVSSVEPEHALLEHTPRTLEFGNLHLIAMALYALTAERHHAQAFTLG